MLKLTLIAIALVGVLVAPALRAQEDKPGEGRAHPSTPASKAEKEAAKQNRRATSKEIAHGKGSLDAENSDRTAGSVAPKPKASPEEKKAAKAKRKSEGAAAAKAGSGRLDDEGRVKPEN